MTAFDLLINGPTALRGQRELENKSSQIITIRQTQITKTKSQPSLSFRANK